MIRFVAVQQKNGRAVPGNCIIRGLAQIFPDPHWKNYLRCCIKLLNATNVCIWPTQNDWPRKNGGLGIRNMTTCAVQMTMLLLLDSNSELFQDLAGFDIPIFAIKCVALCGNYWKGVLIDLKSSLVSTLLQVDIHRVFPLLSQQPKVSPESGFLVQWPVKPGIRRPGTPL